MDLEAITRRGRRAALIAIALALSVTAAGSHDTALTPLAELGKRVFFDETMSATGTQSCASCHAPDVGFSGPNERFNRTSLETVVNFYNTRDVKPRCPNPFTAESEAVAQGCWPEPEVPQTMNRRELGNLQLTVDEERAVVEFMKTLNDGFASTAR